MRFHSRLIHGGASKQGISSQQCERNNIWCGWFNDAEGTQSGSRKESTMCQQIGMKKQSQSAVLDGSAYQISTVQLFQREDSQEEADYRTKANDNDQVR